MNNNFEAQEDEADCIRYVKSLHWRTYSSQNWQQKKWRQYVWAYHRLIEQFDVQIGEILDHIKQGVLAKNTIDIFFSDHGDGCACHQWTHFNLRNCHIRMQPAVTWLYII